MVMNLSDEQKNELRKIIEIGKVMGGSQEMDSMLVSQMMSVLMPETDRVDDLASAYGVLSNAGVEDTGLQGELKSEIYNQLGMDSSRSATNDILQKKFLQDFSTDIGNAKKLARNLELQRQAEVNPGLIEQYYTTPQGFLESKKARAQRAGFNIR